MRCLVALFAIMIVSGCKSSAQKAAEARAQDRQKIQSELGQEQSLKADREALSDLRKNIPPETQKANDELALFLNLMPQGTEQPNMVRERFSQLVQKQRSGFRTKMERLRQDFRSQETRAREDFMVAQQTRRDKFMKARRDQRERERFHQDQERERIRFQEEQRDRRTSFEAELSAQQKDFDAYMRDKQTEFNEQFRLYSKQYSEKPKPKKAVTGDDFKRLDQAPANPLGTED